MIKTNVNICTLFQNIRENLVNNSKPGKHGEQQNVETEMTS